jgi:hypothetical protein
MYASTFWSLFLLDTYYLIHTAPESMGLVEGSTTPQGFCSFENRNANLGTKKRIGKMPKKNEKKQNALKHGAYSHEIMLPGEKRADYDALSTATFEEWAPEGVTEQCLVADLVGLRWRKWRMDRYDQVRLQQRTDKVRLENECNRHRKNLKNLGTEFSKTDSVEAAEKILDRLSPVYVEIIMGWIPRDKCKDPTQWGQEIGKFLSNLKPDEPLEGPDLFAAIVNPDSMETEISRSNRLDEAIDRKIKRLMQVKTAKQIFPSMRKNAKPEPKLINPPAGADDQSPAIIEYKGEPAADAQIIISEALDTDIGAFRPQNVVAIEETLVGEYGSVSISPDVTEKGHSDEEHARVEFFAKPPPMATLEEWQKYCALSHDLLEREGYSRGVGLINCI